MIPIDTYFDLYQHDLPAQESILRGMEVSCLHHREEALLTLVRSALDRVIAARDLDLQFDQGRVTPLERQDAQRIDEDLDADLRAVHRLTTAVSQTPGHPQQQAAARFLVEAFPNGLGTHINANYDEQASANAAWLRVVARPEHAALLQALSLDAIPARVAALNEALRVALKAATPVTRAERDAAAHRAHAATRRTIAAVVGTFDDDDVAQARRRDDILADLRGVQARMRARFVGRMPTPTETCTTPTDKVADGTPTEAPTPEPASKVA